MNDSGDPPCYVAAADQDEIQIVCVNTDLASVLLKLGFQKGPEPSTLTISASTEKEKTSMFRKLQELDIAFSSATSGWSPTELFEMYIEHGHLSFPFKSITWSGPGKWETRLKTSSD